MAVPQTESVPGRIWRFADCEFDDLRRELRVRGEAVDVETKPLDVLRQLLLQAGEVVTKEELFESVWPGVAVVESSLATAVSKLRRALGDDSIVATVPRVGYRLAVPVTSRAIPRPLWPDLQVSDGDPVPGRPHWRLKTLLNRSPSSEVWLVEHRQTHEMRVFKFAPDEARLRCLKREVTVSRLLRESLGVRPCFVRLLEWNFESHPYYLESEYCGPNLAAWAELEGGLSNIPLATRLRVFVEIAEALAAAHTVDVLHKDLKPTNILIAAGDDGAPQTKIADFGSASLLAPARLDALGITNLGFTDGISTKSLTGTLMYVAPEVLGGQSPTKAADVYALGVLLFQLVTGDFRRPLAPGWEEAVADPLLREDIATAASGEPARRLTSAQELVERLRTLEQRGEARAAAAVADEHARTAARKRADSRARRPSLVVAVVALVVAGLLGLILYLRSPARPPTVTSVAVLPFQNVGSDPSIDFLRVALPDEIATILSSTRAIAVRPFATSGKYDQPAVDLRAAAWEMRVSKVITGHFTRTADQLHITLEAIDGATNQVVWRETIDTPARSLIATQTQVGLRVRGGLAAALGAPFAATGKEPRNEEAYGLYLRSLAIAHDFAPNPSAIKMLERAVELDAEYPPAWLALSRRYYTEARYVSGNAALMERYDAATARAAALDPDYVPARALIIMRQVERGDLAGAHREADDLVRRRADSVDAHFILSYVLRYAGLLQESARHCESAFFLDPKTTTAGLRSCAFVFLNLGDYPRAMNYIDLDLGSDFSKAMTIHMLVRQGQDAEALQIGVPNIPQWASYSLLLACLQRRPAAQLDTLATGLRASDDPETNYVTAAHLAYCGRTDAALELLGQSVKGNYCGYPVMDSDPYFATVRSSPRFAEIRAAAVDCQQKFLAQRGR